jgi:hypothetical protein
MQHWEDAVTQEISAEAIIRVAVVLDPGKLVLFRIRVDCPTRDVQQGSQITVPRFGHRRRANHTSAPQQIQEDGFGLVVLMLSQQYPIHSAVCKRFIANATRGGLQAFAGNFPHMNFYADKRNLPKSANRGTVLSPFRGHLVQTMINVDGRQSAGPFAGVEQCM